MARPHQSRFRVLALVAWAIVSALATTLYVFNVYLPSFNTEHTSIEGRGQGRATTVPAPAIAPRVWFVVVDGMGYETAAGLAAFAPLREQGAFRSIHSEYPSFTSPAIVTMNTGLPPRDHGVRLNGAFEGVRDLDSLVRSATDSGVSVFVRPRDFGDFARLMHPAPEVVRPGRLTFATELLPELRSHAARQLWFVHIEEVDEAGHGHGPESPEYASASEHAGVLVARLARSLDLSKDGLFVISDHGHRPGGGHGGTEPASMAAFALYVGPTAKRGVVLPERPMRDVASTLAVLAGIATPGANIGRPMLDMFDVDDVTRAHLLAEPFEQTSRQLCVLHSTDACKHNERLSLALDQGEDASDADAHLVALSEEREASLDSTSHRSTMFRVGAAGLFLLLVWGGLFRLAPRPSAPRRCRWPLALFVVMWAAYGSIMWMQGYSPSFSGMAPEAYFLPDASRAVGAAVAAVVILAWRGGAFDKERADGRLPYFILLGTLTPLVLLAAIAGYDPASLPDPIAGVLVLQAAPIQLGAAVAAIVVVVVQRWRGVLSIAPET